MTKQERTSQALDAIKKATSLIASAAHDYEVAGMNREFQLTYDMLIESHRLLGAVKPKRKKKARV